LNGRDITDFGFFFTKTLAPTVVVSNDADLITNLVALVGTQDHVQLIRGVDPYCNKMMKSLYDATDTPNLRDDILKKG
jgi:predicted nuclease of predicted toxin-antitoxin system